MRALFKRCEPRKLKPQSGNSSSGSRHVYIHLYVFWFTFYVYRSYEKRIKKIVRTTNDSLWSKVSSAFARSARIQL